MAVTIKDVAKKAGVSRACVSKYLNNVPYVSEKTKRKIANAIKVLDYIPNIMARNLTRKKSNVITLIIEDITNPFFPEIVEGVESLADSLGYRILLINLKNKNEKAIDNYFKYILEYRADGILSTSGNISQKYLDSFQTKMYPIVLISVIIPNTDLDCVIIDNYQGAHLMTKYLISLNHKRIAHITGDLNMQDAKDRFSGYKAALKDAGITIKKEYTEKSDYSEKGGYSAAKRLISLKERPTAIFCANDYTAFGAINLINGAGLEVPGDISVAGFGNIHFSGLSFVNLTTVDEPKMQLGEIALKILIDRINSKEEKKATQKIILEPRVIIRGTTKHL